MNISYLPINSLKTLAINCTLCSWNLNTVIKLRPSQTTTRSANLELDTNDGTIPTENIRNMQGSKYWCIQYANWDLTLHFIKIVSSSRLGDDALPARNGWLLCALTKLKCNLQRSHNKTRQATSGKRRVSNTGSHYIVLLCRFMRNARLLSRLIGLLYTC